MLTRLQWLDRVCTLFITEARNYQVWNKVPPEDLDEDIVKVCVIGRAPAWCSLCSGQSQGEPDAAFQPSGPPGISQLKCVADIADCRSHRVPKFRKALHGRGGPQTC